MTITTIIVFFTFLLCTVGAGIAVWSILSTRKKYYLDYMQRKRRND